MDASHICLSVFLHSEGSTWVYILIVLLSNSFYAYRLMRHSFLHGSEAEFLFHAPSFCRPRAFLLYTLQISEEDKCWVLPPERKLSYHRAALGTYALSLLLQLGKFPAARKISSFFHQLLGSSRHSMWKVLDVSEFRKMMTFASILLKAAASVSKGAMSSWLPESCYLHGRKCCLRAGYVQGVKRCLQRSAIKQPCAYMHLLWDVASERGELRSSPLHSNRCPQLWQER